MYERFYDLRERPFSLSPDPAYLFRSGVHREALSYLRYGIEGYAGFVVITGEIGSGKTTLLQSALRGLDQQTNVSRIVNTMLDARELIEAVMLDFGLEPDPTWSKPRLLRELARYLVEQRNAGRLALLLIDEAQNLTLAALEEVRMLSNFETEQSKLIQIVMVGQSGLRETLARPELEQMRQRITVSYHLMPLAPEETLGYINHRLRRAANGAPLEFPTDAADLVHRHSGGVPRMINVIADAVLLYGYGDDQRQITAALTSKAIEDLAAHGVITAPRTSVSVAVPAPTPSPLSLSSERDLLAREIRIAERERQIAEQQRVLDGEFRRLAAMLRSDAIQGQPAGAPGVPVAAGQAPRPVEGTPASDSVPPPAWQAAPPRPPGSPAAVSERTPRDSRWSDLAYRASTRPMATTSRTARTVDNPVVLNPNRPLIGLAPVPSPLTYQASNGAQPETFWSRLRRGIFGDSRAPFDK